MNNVWCLCFTQQEAHPLFIGTVAEAKSELVIIINEKKANAMVF